MDRPRGNERHPFPPVHQIGTGMITGAPYIGPASPLSGVDHSTRGPFADGDAASMERDTRTFSSDAMLSRTMRSSCADGAKDGWVRASPQTFRVIWTGVTSSPQGKPHHPNRSDCSVALSFACLPQEAHEICGELFQFVITMADQTECDVCTSTDPTLLHWGHVPW